jgi:hypothetical protein
MRAKFAAVLVASSEARRFWATNAGVPGSKEDGSVHGEPRTAEEDFVVDEDEVKSELEDPMHSTLSSSASSASSSTDTASARL